MWKDDQRQTLNHQIPEENTGKLKLGPVAPNAMRNTHPPKKTLPIYSRRETPKIRNAGF